MPVQTKVEFHDAGITAGLDKLIVDVRQKVLFSGAAAMAQVLYDEVKSNAARHIKTGTLYGSIYRVYSKERSTVDRVTYHISWNKRTAPHGQLLEFGTSRAPAYPFVRPAFARAQDAINAGTRRMADRLKGDGL